VRDTVKRIPGASGTVQRFAKENPARAAHAPDDRCVTVRAAIPCVGKARGADGIVGIDPVLDGKGDAVERPNDLPLNEQLIQLVSPPERGVSRKLDHGVEFRVDRLDAVEMSAHNLLRGRLLLADDASQLGCREVR
jgi:hypothetical protein